MLTLKNNFKINQKNSHNYKKKLSKILKLKKKRNKALLRKQKINCLNKKINLKKNPKFLKFGKNKLTL